MQIDWPNELALFKAEEDAKERRRRAILAACEDRANKELVVMITISKQLGVIQDQIGELREFLVSQAKEGGAA